jgi:hypothetical protein
MWRLHWWRPPYGRALDLLACTLKARRLKAKVEIDPFDCTMTCGDLSEEVLVAPHVPGEGGAGVQQ